MGGRSISGRPPPPDRPHYHSRIFFCSAAIFERELADFGTVSDLEPKKTLLYRILKEMAQAKVAQRLSAAEYLFSVSSQPRLKSVAKFTGEGWSCDKAEVGKGVDQISRWLLAANQGS